MYYIAKGCQLSGSITIGENVSIWYNAVIRNTNSLLIIGDNTNIQDNSTIHADLFPVNIGKDVTIGHGAIIHGCTIGNNCIIGMGCIIMNNACIGNNCIIGAGTLITESKQIPDNSLVYGNPAKIIRQLNKEDIVQITKSSIEYLQQAKIELEKI